MSSSLISYVAFVFSLFVSDLSFFLCLGEAVLRDCSISWVSLLICSSLIRVCAEENPSKIIYSKVNRFRRETKIK